MATTEQDTNDSELSLRDQLDAAFTDAEGTDDAPAAAPAPAQTETAAAKPDTEAATDGRVRDEHGRFSKGGTPPAAAPVAQATPPVQGAQPPAAPEPKAPASWRPHVREKWTGVDPEIRAEVTRREHEMQTVLQDSAQARQFVTAFENVVRPYEMFIRAENSNPLQAVQNLMQTAADLRVGTPQAKAQLVAGIIQNFAIDVEALDTILAQMRQGGAIPQAGGQQQQFRDPRVDMLLAQQQQYTQQQAEAAERAQRTELEAFAADPKHEFYADVRNTMADLVEIRVKQGQPIDLEKIYAQACAMDDSVSKIMATRAQATKATGNTQAVLRAKRAASSVKGDSTLPGATVPAGDSIRASIEAALEGLQDT